jgi:hypothetical protein
MYEQVEKPKENKSRAVSNSEAQKKSNGKQGFGFLDNRPQSIVLRVRQARMSEGAQHYPNSSEMPIQRFPKTELKNGLGSEFLEKHIANAGVPTLNSQEEKENVLESVYYHRPKDDRKSMNTVFFADPSAIEDDLKATAGDDLDYGTLYTTTNTYDAITVLRVYREDAEKYAKGEIQIGTACPVVKINKADGVPSFNHLQNTNPVNLATKVNVIE